MSLVPDYTQQCCNVNFLLKKQIREDMNRRTITSLDNITNQLKISSVIKMFMITT